MEPPGCFLEYIKGMSETKERVEKAAQAFRENVTEVRTQPGMLSIALGALNSLLSCMATIPLLQKRIEHEKSKQEQNILSTPPGSSLSLHAADI